MNYNFSKHIGRGGFAQVDIVTNEHGYSFAQKTYAPDPQLIKAVGDDHLKRRFVREVRYQSTINHPNIVQIIDFFLDEDPPRFIMPLAECTLRDELQQDPTLGANLHTALFDILAGLEHLHSKGLVHRDLKPGNVLHFNDGNGLTRYAISDFGLMSAVNSDSSTLTGTNANGGTENYAAPELIGDFRRATASADIYALGAILHDIFGNAAQRIPYTELTLPGPVGPIIENCTKRLPLRRYSSVSILRDELYQVLNTQPVSFNSSNEEAVVNLLRSKTELNDEEWDIVFIQLARNTDNQIPVVNILSALSIDHINLLHRQYDLFTAMGDYFAEHLRRNQFDFNYCDVLASKAEQFFNQADIGLQSKIAVALLLLGTSHNRWYVEGKAANMLDNTISPDLAQRISIEIEAEQLNFRNQINHLCTSIHLQPTFLHPILQEIL